MNNDFNESMEAKEENWNDRKLTKKIRIFANVFFVVIAAGVITVFIIADIPYNVLKEIFNEAT